MPHHRVRERWLAPTAILSLGVVGAAVGGSLRSPSAAPPAVYLGALSAGVLALLAVSATPAVANRLATISVLAVLFLSRPLDDPTAWAIVFALLAAACVGVALSMPAGPRRLAWIAWATAAQWTLHADRLWTGPFAAGSLVVLVVAPIAAGLLIARVCDRGGLRLGVVTSLLALATGPGWSRVTLLALLVAAIATELSRRLRVPALLPVVGAIGASPGFLAEPWLAVALAGVGAAALSPIEAAGSVGSRRLLAGTSRAALGVVAACALVGLGGGAPPWSRGRPLADLAGAAERHAGRPPSVLHEGWSLRLDDDVLRFVTPPGAPVRTLSIDSFLLDGAALECGRKVAEVALVEGERTLWSAPVYAGRATGDWAAERPDVRVRSACAPPPSFLRWPAPGGRFFSRRYRALWEVGRPTAATSLEIRPAERKPGFRFVVTRVAIGS